MNISKETEVKEVDAVCLFCGFRPEALGDALQDRHCRAVKWDKQSTKNQIAIESRGDRLPAELSEAVSPALPESSVSLRSKMEMSNLDQLFSRTGANLILEMRTSFLSIQIL